MNGLKGMISLQIAGLLILSHLALIPISLAKGTNNFYIYGVQNSINMGEPNEKVYRDYYINMGTRHGLKIGTKVEVIRQVSSYDLQQRKLHKDVSFPIADLQIIHAEADLAIARLEKMRDETNTPVIQPRAVMVGDIVRPVR